MKGKQNKLVIQSFNIQYVLQNQNSMISTSCLPAQTFSVHKKHG